MSMRPLDLDLRGARRGTRRPGMLLALAALAATGALGWQYSETLEELDAVERHLEQAGAQARAAAAGRRPSPNVRNAVLEVKQAAQVARQLNVPWEALFSALEAAATPDVALLSIESDVGNRRVRLSGEARHLDGLLDYARSLRMRPALAEVYLHSHDVLDLDPQHPVRFVVTAGWVHEPDGNRHEPAH